MCTLDALQVCQFIRPIEHSWSDLHVAIHQTMHAQSIICLKGNIILTALYQDIQQSVQIHIMRKQKEN